MRITSRQLRQIIREELYRGMYEADAPPPTANLSPGQLKSKRLYDEGLVELFYDDGSASVKLGEFPKDKPELFAAAIKKHPEFDGLNIDMYRVQVVDLVDVGDGTMKYKKSPYYPHQHELTRGAVSKIMRTVSDAEKPKIEAAGIVKSAWKSYKGKIDGAVTRLTNRSPGAKYNVKITYTTNTDGTVSDVSVTCTPPDPEFTKDLQYQVSQFKTRPIPVKHVNTVTLDIGK